MDSPRPNEVTLFGTNYDGHAADPDQIVDDESDLCICDRCGGEGWIDYLDGDGGDWGEDCPSEENHPITCRACRGTGRIS